MKSMKEKRGITLIALAVTIVVILILAGVTIDVTLGENGILNKSKEAANRMNNLVKEDEAELNELLNELNETMDSNWNSNIEIPEENTVPEPEPGPPTIEDTTGIQEETVQVEDEYGNKVTIPKGFEVVEEEGTTVPEGIVIQDKDGNQFVWIPVGRVYKDSTGTNYSDIQLGRYTFDRNSGAPTLRQAAYTEENPKNYEQLVIIDSYFQEYTTRSNPGGIQSSGTDALNAIAKNLVAFVDSVKKNGGYYLARYEASKGSGNSIENYKPSSKSAYPWIEATQIEASKISKNMYNNDNSVGVESDLVNSYAYDTAIVFIQEMGHINYANYTGGADTKPTNTGKTGDKVCNIFDLAGNMKEWTTENARLPKEKPGVTRGAIWGNDEAYTVEREATNVGINYADLSFRVVVYIK